MSAVVNTILSTLTGLILGFIISYVKSGKAQNEAIKNLLKSNLVNQYYTYKSIGKVPRYIKETWYAMYESYTALNGNSFVKDDIKPKWDRLEIDDTND